MMLSAWCYHFHFNSWPQLMDVHKYYIREKKWKIKNRTGENQEESLNSYSNSCLTSINYMCTKVNWCELKAVAESPRGYWCMFEVCVCVCFVVDDENIHFVWFERPKSWAWLDQRLVMNALRQQTMSKGLSARALGLWGGRLLGCCYCFVNSASAIGFIQTNCVSTTLPPFIKHQVCMYGAWLSMWRQSLRMVHVFYSDVVDWQIFC